MSKKTVENKESDILFRLQDWPDMEIEAAIDATSDATEVDLEAAFCWAL